MRRADGRALLVLAQDLDGVRVDRDVLRRGREGHGQGEGTDDPDGVRVAPDAGEQQPDHPSAICVTAIQPRRRPQNGGT